MSLTLQNALYCVIQFRLRSRSRNQRRRREDANPLGKVPTEFESSSNPVHDARIGCAIPETGEPYRKLVQEE